MLPEGWNWREPDYAAAFQMRMEALQRIRANPECLPELKAYYADHIDDFINDWGVSYEPRNPEIGLPAVIPFMLWQEQRDLINWILKKWRNREKGMIEKSRDWGVSWLTIGVGCSLCLFFDGLTIGFGSRKEEYVDKSAGLGAVKPMKALLPKARMFMEYLPEEFRGGWVAWRDAPYMRIGFPETGSIITGEAGDQIGRGDRTSITFVDEHAYVDRAASVDAALSQTTNCQIDISSVRGMNNEFAKKRHSGRVEVLICDWHTDPRKDQEWYEKQCQELDPVVVAQEIDRDYTASVDGIVIPGQWVRAAVNAFSKIGIASTGALSASLDVADAGADLNAWGAKRGVEVIAAEEWSGKGADIFVTTERAFSLCDELQISDLRYDADGLGASVRGDARVINERRLQARLRQITVAAFRGSGAVADPDAPVYPGGKDQQPRTNADFFLNGNSQSWWGLRDRFRKTWMWVQHVETKGEKGKPCAPDDIISLNSEAIGPLLPKLVTELSQATYLINGAGKIVIDKTPPGMKSPNLADMVKMLFGRVEEGVQVTPAILRGLGVEMRMPRGGMGSRASMRLRRLR